MSIRTLMLAVGLVSAIGISGCTSTSVSTHGFSSAVTSAVANKKRADRDVKKARIEIKALSRTIRREERKVTRAQRKLKRSKKLSTKKKRALNSEIAKSKRVIRTEKRKLARLERGLRRSENRSLRARANADRAKKREKALKLASQRRDNARRLAADRREKRRLARAERNNTRLASRGGALFGFASDPAVKYARDYRARVDSGFSLPAIPIDKMDKRFLRQEVRYLTRERPGTLIVDTRRRFLYLVQPGGRAMRYGIGVGKAGFAWAGTANVAWKQQWPKWTPPDEMIARRPSLAKFGGENGMPGGPQNPLGARALYIHQNGKDTLYRIHGSPEWASIGTAASSGCIRLINQDAIDLYGRVKNGARIVVKQS